MTKKGNALLLATVAMAIYIRCLRCQTDKGIGDNQSTAIAVETSQPKLVVQPSPVIRRVLGSALVVSCQASGKPTPEVTWFKDGVRIESTNSNSVDEERISLLNSGYLVITQIDLSDGGQYECLAMNSVGEDRAEMKLMVLGAEGSGCADGTTDGLIGYEDIQACRGRWSGHVKNGRRLCSIGWRVCSPRDSASLWMLSWTDVTHLQGCYAYNADNSMQCTRCHRENMAGIGSQCKRHQRNHPPTCLSVGRIDVFPSSAAGRCEYAENITSGVLCCKRLEPNQGDSRTPSGGGRSLSGKCQPRCANGGTCASSNKCQCPPGYKGTSCQIAVCPNGCAPNASCVSPGKCLCHPGFSGPKCRRKLPEVPPRPPPLGLCPRPCLNGGRCRQGHCKCTPRYYGSHCQKDRKDNGTRSPNSTE